MGAALLVLWASVAAAAAAEAGGRLLVVERATALTALAADGEAVWFAVVPPPPIQANPEAPPVFIPVRADGRSATGTAVLGLWTPKGVKWLTPLPGDVAQGGRNAYAISDIVPQDGGAWVTGPVNRPERPIGRYYLARVDRRGTARIAEADDGTAALALAPAKEWPYVARGAERSGQASAARITWPGRWARDFVLAGTGGSFEWTPGHGLAPAPDGVWGVAHFRGTVRVGGASARSPALKDLPFHAGPDGGLPPPTRRGSSGRPSRTSRPPPTECAPRGWRAGSGRRRRRAPRDRWRAGASPRSTPDPCPARPCSPPRAAHRARAW